MTCPHRLYAPRGQSADTCDAQPRSRSWTLKLQGAAREPSATWKGSRSVRREDRRIRSTNCSAAAAVLRSVKTPRFALWRGSRIRKRAGSSLGSHGPSVSGRASTTSAYAVTKRGFASSTTLDVLPSTCEQGPEDSSVAVKMLRHRQIKRAERGDVRRSGRHGRNPQAGVSADGGSRGTLASGIWQGVCVE
jgi:hypothetical protein